MDTSHPKTVRRRLLIFLYERYQQDPLDMLGPEDFLENGVVERGDLLANMYYLQDRGLVELLTGYNPPLFAAARITADGIDLVENQHAFNLRFPPALEELEKTLAGVPVLVEQLMEQAELSPLDGEERGALLRDIQFLRDEIARPAVRWRKHVIAAILDWVEAHFRRAEETAEEALPALRPLEAALESEEEFLHGR